MVTGSFNAEAQALWDFTRCVRPDGTAYGTSGKCRKGTESAYAKWNVLAQGNYGKVLLSPDGKRVAKTLLERDGQKGEFGPYEIELATKMGKLGFSPKIHSADKDHIEMDVAKGKPLWASYKREENEPRMNATQARKAAKAIRALHEMGFAHNDNHSQQWLVDGDDVKWVDFGLAQPLSKGSRRALHDLNKIANLVNWDNPELDGDPYVELVRRSRSAYKAAGSSQKKQEAAADQYLRELEAL